MNDAKTKQQLIEKITNSTNILVTVSNNPSVDALSAALALTLILNKLSKHTTAIFSGQVPPAITFLDSAKTFETSIDSLRDFIIALDKEKADHLRYKVDGDVVKIFITPYKTTLSSDDLEFSQGDYNVELVLALGVENQTHLDGALEAHGSILHDATVVTISNSAESSSLGSIDWRDETASSLSEMLVGLTESLQSETPLIDQEIATALLTGIVAETDRFSNPKTSSKVMTVAAQLMAAGADQQLIAAKLQESHEIGVGAEPSGDSYTQPLGQLAGLQSPKPVKEGLAISHGEVTPPVEPVVALPISEPTILAPVSEPIPAVALPEEPLVAPVPATPTLDVPAVESGKIADAYAFDPLEAAPSIPTTPATAPLLGGLPSAPTPAPQPSVIGAAPSSDLTTPLASQPEIIPTTLAPVTPESVIPPSPEISKHSYLSDTPDSSAPINSTEGGVSSSGNTDIFANLAPPPSVPTDPTGEAAEKGRDEASRDDALAQVSAAYDQPAIPQPFSPAPGITLPPPPPLPDFGALPTTPTAPAYALDATAQQPERLGDILAPSPPPAASDPGQFQIPGQ